MRIAICDDERFFRKELRQLLKQYKTDRLIQIDVTEFENGDELLASDLAFDMVFLDYQMPDMDGMETARILRSKNSICCIVFITNFPNFFIKDAFEVNTYRFFEKPVDAAKVYEMLDLYIKQQKALAPIIISNSDGQYAIPAKDIVYIVASGKYSNIYTRNGIKRSAKNLSRILELLPKHCFFRVHRSYAVNMHFIKSIEQTKIIFIDGNTVNASQFYLGAFKKAYFNFITNYFPRP